MGWRCRHLLKTQAENPAAALENSAEVAHDLDLWATFGVQGIA
jgi:hypothetical protein